MLPEFNIEIDNSNFEVVQIPSKTYRDNQDSINGKIDGKQAIEQTISHILSTERYAYVIYPDNYGMELEKYIGQPFEYLEATIENDLRSALTQDDRITDIKVTNIRKLSIDKVLVEFNAFTVEGIIETEANFGL